MSTQKYKDLRVNAAKKSIDKAREKASRAQEAIDKVEADAARKVEALEAVIEQAAVEATIAKDTLAWLEQMPVVD